MPLAMDPEFLKAIMAKTGGRAPAPRPPVGDVETRRKTANAMVQAVFTSGVPDSPDVDARDVHITTPDGQTVLCRWITKKDAKPPGSAIVHLHGGGMINFSVHTFELFMKQLVSSTGVPILSVDYQLAPEARAPSQVLAGYAALQYLHAHAGELGIDPARIAVMGESAGGGLAASLAHYAKQKSGPAIRKQILIYPQLDDRTTQADASVAPYLSFTPDDNQTSWGALLGDKFGTADVPAIHVPARMSIEEAQGLPDAYIDVGELDLFREEDMEYARKLGKAGVSCELHVYPGVPHGFESIAPDTAAGKSAIANRIAAIKSF